MCKYCNYVLDSEKYDPMDLVVSRFKVNNADIGELGVDMVPTHVNEGDGSWRKIGNIRLYIRPTNDDYFTQDKIEINFCPMCGRDLRDLPPDEI